MKTIEQIRRENIAILAENAGGITKLQERTGKSYVQLHQWVTGAIHSSTGKPRVISNETAREIESACGMEMGWMDHLHHAELIEVEEEEKEKSHVLIEFQAEIEVYISERKCICIKSKDYSGEVSPVITIHSQYIDALVSRLLQLKEELSGNFREFPGKEGEQ